MSLFDTKKRLFSEMAQSAKGGMMADIRKKYGPKPPDPITDEPGSPPDEGLSDADLEPLLSITLEVKKGHSDAEPDPKDPNELDENEPSSMG